MNFGFSLAPAHAWTASPKQTTYLLSPPWPPLLWPISETTSFIMVPLLVINIYWSLPLRNTKNTECPLCWGLYKLRIEETFGLLTSNCSLKYPQSIQSIIFFNKEHRLLTFTTQHLTKHDLNKKVSISAYQRCSKFPFMNAYSLWISCH